MSGNYDLAVIGAGVAGLSAALFAARLGMHTVLVDRMGLGGQLINAGVLDSYPGLPDSTSGASFVGRLLDQAMDLGVEPELSTVLRIEVAPELFTLHTDGRVLGARAVIVATGGTAIKLGVPGEDELEGRGVSHCAVCDGGFFAERDVIVVGGGDEAFYSAIHLSELCRSVLIVHRRDRFRAAAFLQARVRAKPGIKLSTNTTVVAIHGDRVVQGAVLRDLNSGCESEHPASALFVCIGLAPENGLLRNFVELDDGGRAIVDLHMATTYPGLFAVGSVRAGSPNQIVTAAADGVTAAYSAFHWLAQSQLTSAPIL